MHSIAMLCGLGEVAVLSDVRRKQSKVGFLQIAGVGVFLEFLAAPAIAPVA